jgi:potassium channel subfamily K
LLILLPGYGDVQPYSNAGKSFFVLWSLLAIPALTVLISDLGGTIVLLAADLTALIGSLTVAPTDKEFWRRVKRNWDILFGQNKHPNKPKVNTEQLAVLHKKDKLDDSRLGRWPDLLYARLTQSERDVIDNYGRNCEDSPHERDAFFYHFLIVKEIRTVLRDSQTDRKKTYTYDEWAYFLKLLGIDEENGDMHTKTYNQPKRDSEPGVQVGRVFDHQGKPVEWSWLSLRSPLLSLKSEPEWILDRLLKKMSSEVHLESRAKRERAAASGADTGAGPRFDMLRFMRRTSDGRGSGSGSADNDGLSSAATQQAEHEVEDKSGIGRDKTADPEAEEEDERLGLENETTDYDRDERQRQKKGEWSEADQEAHEKPSK